MIADFITFGGVLFWIIVGVVALILAAQINDEKVGWATVTLLGTIALIVAFTNAPLKTLADHPIYILYGFLAYLGVAVVWATIKWRAFYLPKIFDAYEAYRDQWLNSRQLNDMPADTKIREEFAKNARERGVDVSRTRMATNNKARITTWMFFWPFSLLETFFGDFLSQVFTTLYKMVAGLFQRMSDGMASKYSELN